MIQTGRAPDFELTSTEEKQVKLSRITPLWPVLLVFFRSRCQACVEMMPKIREFEIAYRGADLEAIGVSQDGPHVTSRFAEEVKWSGRVVIDPPPHETSKAYGVEMLPAAALVGVDEQILATAEGTDARAWNDLSRAVAELTGWLYAPIFFEPLSSLEPCPSL